ncbi:MAG: AbrB/MazE/SpoVT family DNA-binding domain-containing protein [Candidatus Omnitrophica bacterium]|nr:hypothetical protein [bacterium]NUN95680.1 AbrB/MazE/SpoVT family DNA-binding domain-containing protein [Candidatus Omnitrophota bacterium]
MYSTKVRRIGNSLGVILPAEILARLRVTEGDRLFFTEDQDGARISPSDPDFESVMESFEVMRKQYRNAFRELAK